MGPDNTTIEYEYSNGVESAVTKAGSFTLGYPLYSLKFLNDEFAFPKKQKGIKNRYYTSAVYQFGRSFVQFTDTIQDLNDTDIQVIDYFAKSLSNPSIVELYTAKTKIEFEGKKYSVYLQKGLVPYIQKDMKCLMAYGLMGFNEELVLFMTEFSEAK